MDLLEKDQSSTSNGALAVGMQILVGDQLIRVPDDLAAAYRPGDRLLAIPGSGTLLHVPRAEHQLAQTAVGMARAAFSSLAAVSDDAITSFYDLFAGRLADDGVWNEIARVNAGDVQRARARGRSTTRLAVSAKMRQAMIDGLLAWQAMPSRRGLVVETTHHDGWVLEHVIAGLGVVGFVFEGRPNVFADATGILRGGNTAVMRIGGDALATAQAIVAHALRPALVEAGLPEGAIVLLENSAHASGWALFADPRLSLAVARGSGPAVAQLGAIARQTGTPVSLHGTGGAWIIADATASAARFRAAIYHSLDRKVCNTVNTICIVTKRAPDLIPAFLDMLHERTAGNYKLHVTPSAQPYLPEGLMERRITVWRAAGAVEEQQVDIISAGELGHEWEWEETPEVTLTLVQDPQQAIDLFNEQSPHLVASLISEDTAAHERFFRDVDAPFIGDGFTRWVDGQYALNRPELGLSNWQNGRLFARGAILSGDGVYTLRYRVRQSNPDLHR